MSKLAFDIICSRNQCNHCINGTCSQINGNEYNTQLGYITTTNNNMVNCKLYSSQEKENTKGKNTIKIWSDGSHGYIELNSQHISVFGLRKSKDEFNYIKNNCNEFKISQHVTDRILQLAFEFLKLRELGSKKALIVTI